MGWILKRKRDLKKFRIGLKRKPGSEARERTEKAIKGHEVKLEVILEKKRKEAKKNPLYQGVKDRIVHSKKFRKAARMIVESGGSTEAKISAMEFLKSRGVPEEEAYRFADAVTSLERRGFGDVLVITKKKGKG